MSKTTTRRVLAGLFSGLAFSLFAIPALAQGVPPIAHDPMEGASCTSPSDCGGKLNCVAQKCVSPSATPSNANPPSNGSSGSGSSGPGSRSGDSASGDSDGSSKKSSKGFEGLRGFAGITLGGGPTYLGASTGHTTQGGLLFGLKGGILIDHFELGLEFSPVTFSPYLTAAGAKPNLQLNVYGGYHIPLAKVGSTEICWPIRVGLGFYAVNTLDGDAWVEARADLIGVSTIVGPVLLDLHAPSFRFIADNEAYAMHFMFGVGGAFLPDAVL